MEKQNQRPGKAVKYTQKKANQLTDKTNYQKLDSMSDDSIDYSDIPEKDAHFWAIAEVKDPAKKAISLRVDEDVLNWFKHRGGRYQRLMNQVLRQYMSAHQR